MNSEQLLKHLEKISEAPNAIPRLRRFILDLAVRGKLVEQDPADEPAGELLKRIRQQKQRLTRCFIGEGVNAGFDNSELHFPIPRSWCWVFCTEPAIMISDLGKKVQTKEVQQSGEFPVVDQGKVLIRGYCDDVQKVIRVTDPIIVFGDHTRETKLIDFDFVVGADGVKLLQPIEIDPRFYYLALKWVPLDSRGYARHFKLLRESLIPLPPLGEQHRIVAKVDELMEISDDLELAQTKREKRRDRLVAAALHGLNNGDSIQEDGGQASFQESARFYLNHLPKMTIRPEHVQQLRQAILNLAVRGKLVKQDPRDEPATELLARIRRGVVHGNTKLPKIDESDVPFVLPQGWTWARFPELGTFGRGKSKHRPRNDTALFKGGIFPLVQTGDVARSKGNITTFAGMYNEVGLAQSMMWPKGTLCITIAANIADSGILDFDACFPDSIVGFIPALPLPNVRYFEYFVRTVKGRLLEFAPATAQKNINLGILSEILIPLPPLVEQQRIVARVDELMTLCNELELGLAANAALRSRLSEATAS